MSIFSGALLLSAVNARIHMEPGENGQFELVQSGLISGGGFGNGLSDRRPDNAFDPMFNPNFIDISLGEPDLPTHVPELPIIPDELPSRKLIESKI